MKEYKNKTSQELNKLIMEKRAILRHFKFNSVGSKTKNVKLGKTVKKEIARIMTELSLQSLTKASK